MTEPGSARVRRALRFVEDIHTANSVHGFRLKARRGLRALIPCDDAAVVEREPDADDRADGLGFRHELSMRLPAPAPVVGLVLVGRARRAFSDADRKLLRMLRPHLVEALAAARVRESVAATGGAAHGTLGVVLVGASGRVESQTGVPERLGRELQPGSQLPADVRSHLASAPVPGHGSPVPIVTGDRAHGGRVAVRTVPRQGAGWALVFEELPEEVDLAELEARGLTRREVQVLSMLAHGSTDAQLGLQLGISTRTVQKHVERIHAKLGVNTRTAAVAAAGVIMLNL